MFQTVIVSIKLRHTVRIAVSYTHLDVYKRQVYRRLRRRRIKRTYWVHPINEKTEQAGTFHTFLEELRNDENKFFNYFRMSIPSFDELHEPPHY